MKGKAQTAHRGEALALAAALEALEMDLEIWTDDKNVVFGWHDILEGEQPRGADQDLWSRAALAKLSRQVPVRRIKSCQAWSDAERRGWSREQWSGDAAADAAAGAGAASHAVDPQVAQRYLDAVEKFRKVQTWMTVALEKCAQQRPPPAAARKSRAG